MANSLLMVGSSVYQVLVILDRNDESSDAVKAYFQPTCDCSAPDHVKQNILAADAATVASVKTMIAADPYTIPPAPGGNPTSVILISTKCVGVDLVGTYMSTAGVVSDTLIAAGHSSCF